MDEAFENASRSIADLNMEEKPPVRSLKELIELVSGKSQADNLITGEAGTAEILPFPFTALVGQFEMKLALILALVNPSIGGVLLLGPRGTGKTTAVRSLIHLLPTVMRSVCFYGCMPEDIENGGIDAVCPDCARRFAEGKPLSVQDIVRLVELPLNATLEDVVGGLDERALVHERMRLKRGILAQADRNVLYIDEVNLLANEIIDAILDAAAQGAYTVRRGPSSATYNARFILIGSMNPEEGNLRPQIMDRFGLRVVVKGLTSLQERLEAYRRVRQYSTNPRGMIAAHAAGITQLQEEIQAARQLLIDVSLPEDVAQAGIQLIQHLGIDSLRAEISLFEATRAYAAASGRQAATFEDLGAVAPVTLRLRRSPFITNYLHDRQVEEDEIASLFKNL